VQIVEGRAQSRFVIIAPAVPRCVIRVLMLVAN